MFTLFQRIIFNRNNLPGIQLGTGCIIFLLCLIIWFFQPCLTTFGANEIIWTRDYGDKGDEIGYFIQATTDGGYIVAGSSNTGAGQLKNMYMLRTDALGKSLWNKTYGGDDEEIAYCVEQLNDGGFMLAGSSKSATTSSPSIYIVKTDHLGNLIWNMNLKRNKNAEVLAMKKSADKAIVLIGYIHNDNGLKQGYILKIDSAGKVIWENTFVSTNLEELRGISLTKDGGYIITGYTETIGSGERDVLLLKTDAAGNLQWRRTLRGSGLQCGNSVIASIDGAYLLAGYTSSLMGKDFSSYVAKTDTNGNLLWEKSYACGNENIAQAINLCADGNYIVFNRTYSDMSGISSSYLVKIDGKGNKLGDLNLGKTGPESLAWGLSTADEAYILVGSKTGPNDQSKNVCLTKLKFPSSITYPPVINKGSFTWPDQSEYRGELQNGKANGWGKVNYVDGGSYEGQWRDNLFNGTGTLIIPDGSKYQGNFKDNMFFGKGIYTWPGGERYEGEFRYNKRNGEGTLIWPGGIKYSGEWLDNQAQGYGTIEWPNGERYSGEMRDGQADGLGTYIFANGEKYVGQFSNLIFEGFGTYTWHNGACYIGEFKNDLMNGQGTYIWPNGVQQWGFWRDDKYIGLYPEGFNKKDK